MQVSAEPIHTRNNVLVIGYTIAHEWLSQSIVTCAHAEHYPRVPHLSLGMVKRPLLNVLINK